MPTLALVMIVRNEERCIARALDSARPFVDEMIVLDTGSTDNTIALAKEHGAIVHSFAWSDDFAAARNAALAHSNADWNLILDADEWIEAGGEELRAAAAEGSDFLGFLPITSSFDLNSKVESSTEWMPRLLPRGVTYQGRIHEQPVSNLPKQHIQLTIQHDGYRSAQFEAKKGRNEALLLEALKASPNDPYILYKLGKTNEAYERYVPAAEYYVQALNLTPHEAPFRHDLVVRSLFTLKMAKEHALAIQLSEQEFDLWPHSPDFFFTLGDLYLDAASVMLERAAEYIPIVEYSWKKCLEIGDAPQLSGSVKGFGSYLAAENLAHLYQEFGQLELAAQYHAMAAAARQ